MHPGSISGYFDILGKCKKVYAAHLEPLCKKWELTRSEVDVLLFLYNNPGHDRAADIVARRGMAKSHVSMSVVTLESRGLLERTFSTSDRRTAHLNLTEQGRAIAAEGKELQSRFFAWLYQDITEEELRMWEKINEKIHSNVENIEKV